MAPVKILNLANQITLARISFIIPIVILLHFPNKITCVIAALLFMFASITDMLDGHIARRDNLVTSLGKFLDPLADKLLIGSTLIMFAELGWVDAWITIIILMREMAVTGLRAMAIDEGVVLGADTYGKLKTIAQLFAIFPLIIHYPFFGINFSLIGHVILYIALALTILSGSNYFYIFYKHWKDKDRVQSEDKN